MIDVTTGDQPGRGRWEVKLPFPLNEFREPGKYQIVVRPRHSSRQTRTIRIIPEPDGAKVAPAVQIEIGTDAYEELPRVDLPAVTIQNPDDERPQVIRREKERATNPS